MVSPGAQDPTLQQSTAPHETLADPRGTRLAGPLGETMLLAANVPRLTDKAERVAALTELQSEMMLCAADSRGTDPESYDVEPHIRDAIAELNEKAREDPNEAWKDAHPLTHTDITFGWLRRNKSKAPILDEDGNQIVGKRVGYLNAAQYETPVLYCSDGKLRMLIKTTGDKKMFGAGWPKQYRKTYDGYCRLPNPALVAPVRTRGYTHLVSYKHQQSKTLRDELGLIDKDDPATWYPPGANNPSA